MDLKKLRKMFPNVTFTVAQDSVTVECSPEEREDVKRAMDAWASEVCVGYQRWCAPAVPGQACKPKAKA